MSFFVKIFTITMLLVVSSLGTLLANSVSLVKPVNVSGDSGIDWVSDTFARSIMLELRKDKIQVSVLSEISPDDKFAVISSYRKSSEGRKIIFYVNIVGRDSKRAYAEGDLVISDNLYLLDSLSFVFSPETVYEIKTYIARLVRLYISARIAGNKKFEVINYKFPQEKKSSLISTLKNIEIQNKKINLGAIVMNPAELNSWFDLAIVSMQEGKFSAGFSYLLRYLSKYAPTFASEGELIQDQRVKSAVELIAKMLPGESSRREEAVKDFVLSQFYGDFSDNEVSLLRKSIDKDQFMWPAMKRLGEIYYAKGDYRASIRYMRDYISTANESPSFISIFSMVASFVDEIVKGF